jgi:hypothetical protein
VDIKTAIRWALKHPESIVLRIDYFANRRSPNIISRRIISPIRYEPNGDLLAFCLSRGDNRRFKPGQISSFHLIDADTVLAPASIAYIDLFNSDPQPADCRP